MFHGTWTATAGPTAGEGQILRGTWAGQALPHQPNSARGSWTLISETDQLLADGTWSAEKSAQGWQGTWRARTRDGRSFSGSWTAAIADASVRSLGDMLAKTAEKEIGGSWRSGRFQGNWWLKRSPN